MEKQLLLQATTASDEARSALPLARSALNRAMQLAYAYIVTGTRAPRRSISNGQIRGNPPSGSADLRNCHLRLTDPFVHATSRRRKFTPQHIFANLTVAV